MTKVPPSTSNVPFAMMLPTKTLPPLTVRLFPAPYVPRKRVPSLLQAELVPAITILLPWEGGLAVPKFRPIYAVRLLTRPPLLMTRLLPEAFRPTYKVSRLLQIDPVPVTRTLLPPE